MGGGRRQKGAGGVPAVVQQRQPRQIVHGGQKKHREGRRVDVGPQVYASYEGDQQAPGPSAWRTFFAQTDPRHQKAAVGRLVRALLTQPFEWLTSVDNDVATTTADERVGELTAWVRARLRPTLRCSAPSPQHHHGGDRSSSSDEEDNSGCDDDDGGDDEGDDDDDNDDEEEVEEGEDVEQMTNERKRNKKGKKKAVDVEWEVQVKAVQLVAALAVICGKNLPRRFIADAPLPATITPSPSQRRASASQPIRTTVTAAGSSDARTRAKARARYAEAADAEGTLGDLLMDVIRTVHDVGGNNTNSAAEKEEDARERRSALRVEALEALAVVCFILDDARITSDVCRFVAECYLRSDGARDNQAEVDTLWAGYGSYDAKKGESSSDEESDDGDDSEEESESEEAESEPSENESESEEKDEGRRTSRRDPARTTSPDAAELAEALRVWTFLLSLLPQDEAVCELVGPHKRTLVELALMDSDLGADITASSEVRMHAAVVLTVLALSSGADEEDDEEGDEQHSLDSDVMTNGDKQRLVMMCMEKARARAGERVRGRERRLSQKRERAWFRGLAAQLVDSLTTSAAGIATATARKAKRDESGCEDYFHRQKQPASVAGTPGTRKVETHLTFNTRRPWLVGFAIGDRAGPIHLNQLNGWRWRHVLSFLQRYFGSHFWTMFKARFLAGPDAWTDGQIQLLKTNKATLKGQKTQTKRYRRLTERNKLRDDHYRQYKREYVEQQSLTRWKRSITSEWQATSNAYFAW